MIEKIAGLRRGSRGNSCKYSIIDTCERCPLSVYIDIVCEEKLDGLIISGNPPKELLEAAALKICSEFLVLSGGSDRTMELTRRMHYYYSLILIYSISLNLISMGKHDKDVIDVLNKNGFSCSMPKDEQETAKLISRLKSAISEKKIRMNSEKKRLESLKTGGNTKPTREYYTSTLVMLSKHVGFRLTKDITLAEYAAYLKDYKEEIQRLKQLKDVNKHA